MVTKILQKIQRLLIRIQASLLKLGDVRGSCLKLVLKVCLLGKQGLIVGTSVLLVRHSRLKAIDTLVSKAYLLLEPRIILLQGVCDETLLPGNLLKHLEVALVYVFLCDIGETF